MIVFSTVMRVYDEVISRTVISADNPRFLAFIPAAPTKAALLFDTVVSIASLQGCSWLEASGAIVAEKNARYNIGGVTRTFNEPTLALLVVSEPHRSRFKFDRTRVTARDTGPLVTLGFRERERPTLVRGANGESVFAKGDLDVDPVACEERGRLLA